jgi:hypothetical protein
VNTLQPTKQGTINLHDKYASTEWEQLWADDTFAAVLYRQDNGKFTVLTENNWSIMNTRNIAGFSEAMDNWNASITQHLNKLHN